MKIEVIVAGVFCFISIVASTAYYYTKQQENVSKTMALAMERGIDPMAVRCSYATPNDMVCVAYAASGKRAESAPMLTKK